MQMLGTLHAVSLSCLHSGQVSLSEVESKDYIHCQEMEDTYAGLHISLNEKHLNLLRAMVKNDLVKII